MLNWGWLATTNPYIKWTIWCLLTDRFASNSFCFSSANPFQSILSWGWAELYGRATAHFRDASYSSHAHMFCSLQLCNLVWPRVGAWQEPMINWSVITGKNFKGSFSLRKLTMKVCGRRVILEQLHNLQRLLCLNFSIQISLVFLLLPRNLVAIKSSSPQFLKQTSRLHALTLTSAGTRFNCQDPENSISKNKKSSPVSQEVRDSTQLHYGCQATGTIAINRWNYHDRHCPCRLFSYVVEIVISKYFTTTSPVHYIVKCTGVQFMMQCTSYTYSGVGSWD